MLDQSSNSLSKPISMIKRPSSSSGASTASTAGVKKQKICNKLFLDIESLSKNMQALLNNYEMLVIA